MPEGVAMWSCPRCGEQMSSEVEVCSRCGGAPAGIPVPPKRCPACRTDRIEPAREGKVHCLSCGHEFEDYEEWVRRCRAAAWAATRPAPPSVEEPPPRPAHLGWLAASLLSMGSFYVVWGVVFGSPVLAILCTGLGVLQAIAGGALLWGGRARTSWSASPRACRRSSRCSACR